MAATTDRQAARERLKALALSEIDRLIPLDDKVPLKGEFFTDFEDQADELERTLCPAFLKERVALSNAAEQTTGGRCPYCHSDRVYLEGKHTTGIELLTPHGKLDITKQKARCRSCDRTFSPSGS